MSKIRAAAVQFGVTEDIPTNLQTCLRLIDRAAEQAPDLIVLPEFVNHIAWYENDDHCYRVALSLEDDFIRQIAGRAAAHRCYIKINVTLKRDQGKVTGTNILFNPTGAIAGLNDKQILMGNENNFLEPATEIAPVLDTAVGRVGMYACMDGVIPEVARALAVRGAQILLNSLNSFAHDEAALHIPVRAAENKVFVVAANKVGSLVPEKLRPAVAARLQIDPSFLEGAGESQIVTPDGTVLAKAPRQGEAVVWADIDPRLANDKKRPDGTDLLAARRPSLYHPIAERPQPRPTPSGAESVLVGVLRLQTTGRQAVAQAAAWLAQAEAQDVRLVVLPELFHVTSPADAAAESAAMVRVLQGTLNHCLVATSIVEDGAHVGILLGKDGVLLKQPQLHPCGRHPWAMLGDSLRVIDLEWGRLALIVGDDALYPETLRLAALQGAEVIAAPTLVLEAWEGDLAFKERAAENRINLVVAGKNGGGIYAITEDFTLWTKWKNRPFDGNINYPVVTTAVPHGLTTALVHPAAAANKMVSHRTDVLDGRPWRLAGPIIT